MGLLGLLFMLIICNLTNAQKVYSVEYSNLADVKVFVVKYESQADLKVFKMKYQSQAKEKTLHRHGLSARLNIENQTTIEASCFLHLLQYYLLQSNNYLDSSTVFRFFLCHQPQLLILQQESHLYQVS